MPEVSLQSYGEEMRQLIAQGAYPQAIAIGRHILSLYPKHLHTYRILGEACLEQGEYEQARQLFARALACDPEDLFARVGIAAAHEKKGDWDRAIWHLERGYELSPGNAELRKELQRLQAQRDGTSSARMKLTSGAVARLYARSQLWMQAIPELRNLLKQNPDLADLKVALADALWNAGQKKEAADVCQEILATYPHCLKANLILGEIWLRGEQEAEGRALLQLAQDIDPENATAQKVFGPRSPLPARMVKVPRLEEIAAPVAPEVAVGEETPEEEALPAWVAKTAVAPALEEIPPEAAPAAETVGEEAPAPLAAEAAETAQEDEGIPEWLQRIRERRKDEEIAPAAPEEVEELPEAASDWLRRLREEQELAKETVSEEAAPVVVPTVEEAPAALPAEEGIPDWLKQLEEAAPKAPEVEPAPAVQPLPEWLAEGEKPAVVEELPVEAEAVPPAEAETVEEVLPVEAEAAAPLAAEAVEEAPPAEVGAVAPALEVPEEVAVKAKEAAPVAEVAEAAAPVEEVPVAEAAKPVALAEEVSAPMEETAPPPVAITEEAPAPPAEAAAEAAVVAAPATEVAEAVLEAVAETVPIAEPAPEDALTQARTLRDSGDANGALDRYEELIKGGHLLDKVLADLEEGAAGALALSRTHTLIGDLCMKQERLQKALEAYRRALTMLKA